MIQNPETLYEVAVAHLEERRHETARRRLAQTA
jgi:hypothetical protein